MNPINKLKTYNNYKFSTLTTNIKEKKRKVPY